MQPSRPRARRFPFVANVEVTDLQTEAHTTERMSDLSLFGCQLEASKALSVGTAVRIRITRKGQTFAALGKVANIRPATGMGIVFTGIEDESQLILEKWVAEVREHQERAQTRA